MERLVSPCTMKKTINYHQYLISQHEWADYECGTQKPSTQHKTSSGELYILTFFLSQPCELVKVKILVHYS